MSYLTPFILLYIIDQHKPNTLEIPEKYLIFFLLRLSLNKRRRRAGTAILAGYLGMQWLLTLALRLQFPSWVNPNSRDRRRPCKGHPVIP